MLFRAEIGLVTDRNLVEMPDEHVEAANEHVHAPDEFENETLGNVHGADG